MTRDVGYRTCAKCGYRSLASKWCSVIEFGDEQRCANANTCAQRLMNAFGKSLRTRPNTSGEIAEHS